MVANETVMARALDMGINWFDTAYRYKDGRNEEELASALGSRRKEVYICTKVPKSSPSSMEKMFEKSLKRLRSDYVDMLLVHSVTTREDVTNPETMTFMQKAKQAGKTRFIGVSTHKNMANCIDAAVDAKIYDAVLSTYSYAVSPPPLRTAITRARKEGVGIIAMKTQMGSANPKEFPSSSGGLTPHQAALKWVLDNPDVTCAVPGTRDLRQLAQNVAVMGQRLGALDRANLFLFATAARGMHCLGCGACDGRCPQGVNVSEVRRCAMYLNGYGDPNLARDNYRLVAANAQPCASCTSCTVACAAGTALHPILRGLHARLA